MRYIISHLISGTGPDIKWITDQGLMMNPWSFYVMRIAVSSLENAPTFAYTRCNRFQTGYLHKGALSLVMLRKQA